MSCSADLISQRVPGCVIHTKIKPRPFMCLCHCAEIALDLGLSRAITSSTASCNLLENTFYD